MLNVENLDYNEFMMFCSLQDIPNDVYTEKHHYIPKHMGGEDNDENNHIIELTYEQHKIAHAKLYEEYGNVGDKIAVNLMNGLDQDRKIKIGKAIGEHHKETGHIYRLGKHNVESGFFESIKTTESRSKGGKAAGKIAKESGQVYTIRTEESSRQGGVTAGNLAKERGQIQGLGKYKSEYVIIDPDGNEYQHLFQAVDQLGINKSKIRDDARKSRNGFSRRKKTTDELNRRWTNMS